MADDVKPAMDNDLRELRFRADTRPWNLLEAAGVHARLPGLLARLDAAEAERDRLRAEAAWRPISEAPRDGTRVLLGEPGHVYSGFFGSYWTAGDGSRREPDEEFPTHWRPLPGPPPA